MIHSHCINFFDNETFRNTKSAPSPSFFVTQQFFDIFLLKPLYLLPEFSRPTWAARLSAVLSLLFHQTLRKWIWCEIHWCYLTSAFAVFCLKHTSLLSAFSPLPLLAVVTMFDFPYYAASGLPWMMKNFCKVQLDFFFIFQLLVTEGFFLTNLRLLSGKFRFISILSLKFRRWNVFTWSQVRLIWTNFKMVL